MFRTQTRSIQLGVVLALAVAAMFTTSALAAKPVPYAPTLSVNGLATSASTATSTSTSTNYLVQGCGYNGSYGGVTVVVRTPVAVSFAGQLPDANGCISVSNFWTQGAGHYQVDAFQTIGKKDVLVASTSFDV
jgi:hypothetical protein